MGLLVIADLSRRNPGSLSLPSPPPQQSELQVNDILREEPYNMTSREELDTSGPNAPLLSPIDASPDFRDADDEALDPDLSYSEGWFIWILTFSAGISGLLFGYEYVETIHC